MNDYILTFKLKQHTPIIHFQHDQHGATLRASELKPKLDKFLIKNFKEEEIDYKKWLIGKGEHDALDYKVKIENVSNIDYYLPLPSKYKNKKSENLIQYLSEKTTLDISILAPTPFFANSDKIKFQSGNDEDKVDTVNTKVEELKFALITNSPYAKIFI